jgi:hypothetical protein
LSSLRAVFFKFKVNFSTYIINSLQRWYVLLVSYFMRQLDCNSADDWLSLFSEVWQKERGKNVLLNG